MHLFPPDDAKIELSLTRTPTETQFKNYAYKVKRWGPLSSQTNANVNICLQIPFYFQRRSVHYLCTKTGDLDIIWNIKSDY